MEEIKKIREFYTLEWWITSPENKLKTVSLQKIMAVKEHIPFDILNTLEEEQAYNAIIKLDVMNRNQARALVRHIHKYNQFIIEKEKSFRLERAELNIKYTFNQFLNYSAFATELADIEDLTKIIAEWWPVYNAYAIGKDFTITTENDLNVVKKYYRNIFSVDVFSQKFAVIYKPEVIGSSIQFNYNDIDTLTELKTKSDNETYIYLVKEFIKLVSSCAKAVYHEAQRRL